MFLASFCDLRKETSKGNADNAALAGEYCEKAWYVESLLLWTGELHLRPLLNVQDPFPP